MNTPNSSAMARRTSSSSSLFSLKKGINSFRVRSSPSARAIVDSLLMEFKRNWMSSFFSSSISTAIGYKGSSPIDIVVHKTTTDLKKKLRSKTNPKTTNLEQEQEKPMRRVDLNLTRDENALNQNSKGLLFVVHYQRDYISLSASTYAWAKILKQKGLGKRTLCCNRSDGQNILGILMEENQLEGEKGRKKSTSELVTSATWSRWENEKELTPHKRSSDPLYLSLLRSVNNNGANINVHPMTKLNNPSDIWRKVEWFMNIVSKGNLPAIKEKVMADCVSGTDISVLELVLLEFRRAAAKLKPLFFETCLRDSHGLNLNATSSRLLINDGVLGWSFAGRHKLVVREDTSIAVAVAVAIFDFSAIDEPLVTKISAMVVVGWYTNMFEVVRIGVCLMLLDGSEVFKYPILCTSYFEGNNILFIHNRNPRTPPISYISQTVIPFKKPTSEPSKTGFETKQKTVRICTKKKFICKVFGKKKSFFRKKFVATGLIFERFLAPRSRFFEKCEFDYTIVIVCVQEMVSELKNWSCEILPVLTRDVRYRRSGIVVGGVASSAKIDSGE
ncbi:hypothetical protein LXL04_024955 [Taraxacum kok-saghyz]